MIREDCKELHMTLQGSHMHGAVQDDLEINHRRPADACNGIAWAIKEESKNSLTLIHSLFIFKIYLVKITDSDPWVVRQSTQHSTPLLFIIMP